MAARPEFKLLVRLKATLLASPRWVPVAVTTVVSVAASVLVSVLIVYTTVAVPRWPSTLIVAAVIPGIVAPTVSWICFSMMYELEEARAEAQRSASTDLLTGVLNRRRFIQVAESILGRASRSGRPVAVILLDIDNFKRINDQYGHRAGDEVLQRIGRLCSATLRPEDQVARWGGEEFVALLPDCSAQEALAVARRLRTAMTGALFQVNDGTLQVSASIGVASTELGVEGLDHLLTLADRAMYEVKRNGKDSVMAATAVMSTETLGQGDLFSR